MQKIIFSLLLIAAGFSAYTQNVVRDANAQVRNVASFSKIELSGAINLYLSQGATQGVAVSSEDPNATEKIKTEVRNGVLKIYVENGAWNGWNWGNKHLRAYVTFTTLEKLDVSGASNVELTDPITVGNFNLELSGASNIKGTIKGQDINFELSGASNAKIDFTANSFSLSQSGASNFRGSMTSQKATFDISGASVTEIEGTTGNLVISAGGASNFKGSGLIAENCRIEATGASSASITVNRAIDATASGGSTIKYGGGASITNLDVSGGSTVKKKS